MAPTTKLLLFSVIVIPLFLLPCCSGCIPSEREALLRFQSALNYSSHSYSPFYTDLSSWEKGGDCCLWQGISCHNTTNHVVAVDIQADYAVEGGVITESLCSLTSLSSISMTYMGLTGTLPPCLGNLSSLSVLDLHYNNLDGESVLDDVCKLSNLSVLDLSDNQLNGSLPSCLGSLSSLVELRLSGNRLSGNIPSSSSLSVLQLQDNNFEDETVLDKICKLSNLSIVDLSYNQLNGSLPSCLGSLSSLVELRLSGNRLSGNIPSSSSLSVLDLSDNTFEAEIVFPAVCLLSNLSMLDLSYNQLSGSIPDSLGNLSLLDSLYLSYNQLSGSIPNSFCNLSLLFDLDVSYNQLNGTLPSFSRLSSLTHLYADGNAFSLGIASSVLPSSLYTLYLSLDGQHVISEAFFNNLSELDNLALSNCVHNISTTWIPSFQLTYLSMISCKLDGRIPSWISTQFSLVELELVDNNLTGEIPSWVLGMNLLSINLTTNHLQGQLLPEAAGGNPLTSLDLSRNELSGQIPSIWPPNIIVLLLNDNLLTGNIPPNIQGISSLEIANFANNHLNGIIPPSFANCSKLQELNLGDNKLRGMIPYEFSKFSELRSLVIRNNQLSGPFPLSISNCTKLVFLDVGQNSFTGHIPKSIGNISQLKVLAMRQNNFDGSLPAEIGQLKNLQILDLSSNQLSGLIPHTIFGLQALMVETHEEFSMLPFGITAHSSAGSYGFYYTYKNGLTMNSKGRDENYTYIFPTMMGIDLSDNQLSGELPADLGKLKGLKLFNVSMNNFSGVIPKSIVQMIWLETLDFSTNNFCGQIPPDLSSLSYLEALNFSNNQFTGSIPQGGHIDSFSESSYLGNPNLWGCPLPKKCSWPEFTHSPPPISTSDNGEEQSEESVWYDIGVGLSFVAGFTSVLVFIVLKKKYFERVDKILKILFPWIHNLTL